MSMSKEERLEFNELKWKVHCFDENLYGSYGYTPAPGLNERITTLEKKVAKLLQHLGLSYIPEHQCGPELVKKGGPERPEK